MSVAIGSTLGHFEITAKIGAGGMGEVYRATDTKLGREVAFKVLPAAMASDPERLSRFQREAKTVAGLNHPNIVTIYSVEEADGIHFFTMELVAGQALDELLPAGGFSLERLLALAIPIADAVASAHSRGIIHRDLKPANVMVTDEGGRVKVLDFGLAKMSQPMRDADATETAPLTRDGRVMGTAHYMSPEQVRGSAVDARSDIFSLGTMLYEMAAGRRPFAGESFAEVMAAIQRDDAATLTVVRSDLPRHLGRIVQHCLEKDPDRRYQSALDVRNELEQLRREVGRDELTTSVAPQAGSGAPTGRRLSWRLAAAAGAVVVLALLGTFLLGRNGAPPAEPPAAEPASPSRIVVLPFEDLGQPAVDYFTPGLTEEISSRLATVDGLAVISRISANQYVGTDTTARQIGAELDVGHILRGSVHWSADGDGADRVRVLPDLIRVADDTAVWGDAYDGSVDDIFEVQSEIASRVAEQLGRRLVGATGLGEEARPTASLEAYQAYLRGLHYFRRPNFPTPEFTAKAVAGFSDAVAEDPGFALAWASLSKTHSLVVLLGIDTSPGRRESARQAMQRASELAPEAPEVRIARAFYLYGVEKDYAAALEEFSLAERRLPHHHEIHEGKGYVLRRRGLWDEAVTHLERAYSLNPRFGYMAAEIAYTHNWRRDYDEALRWCEQSIALDPEQVWAYETAALARLLRDGDLAAARASLERMPPSDDTQWFWTWFWQEMHEGRPDEAIARLDDDIGPWVQATAWIESVALLRGQAQELAGDAQAARQSYEAAERQLLEELARSPEDSKMHAALGLAYAGLGRPEEAMRSGRRAVELLPVERDALSGTYPLIDLAQVYTRVGQPAEAIALLEQLLEQPAPLSGPLLRVDPRWQALADEPGFRRLTGGG